MKDISKITGTVVYLNYKNEGCNDIEHLHHSLYEHGFDGRCDYRIEVDVDGIHRGCIGIYLDNAAELGCLKHLLQYLHNTSGLNVSSDSVYVWGRDIVGMNWEGTEYTFWDAVFTESMKNLFTMKPMSYEG